MSVQRDCIHHTGRPAVGQCYLCHKPICKECRYVAPAYGVFCSQECYDRYIAYHSRKQPVIRGSRLKSMVVGLVILAVLAAGAVFVAGALGLPILKPMRDAIFSR